MFGFGTRVQAYRDVFHGPFAHIVLADLMRFSGWRLTNFRADPYETAFREGRRDMMARIIKFSTMSDAEINAIFDQDKAGDNQT